MKTSIILGLLSIVALAVFLRVVVGLAVSAGKSGRKGKPVYERQATAARPESYNGSWDVLPGTPRCSVPINYQGDWYDPKVAAQRDVYDAVVKQAKQNGNTADIDKAWREAWETSPLRQYVENREERPICVPDWPRGGEQ